MAVTTSSLMVRKGGVKTSITALAGGATPSAAANTLDAINIVTVVASDGDSVILPAGCTTGDMVWAINQDSAQDIHVFPPTGGTIQGGTATTGDIAVGQTQAAIFVCTNDTGLTWFGIYGAVFVPA